MKSRNQDCVHCAGRREGGCLEDGDCGFRGEPADRLLFPWSSEAVGTQEKGSVPSLGK